MQEGTKGNFPEATDPNSVHPEALYTTLLLASIVFILARFSFGSLNC